MVEISFEGDRIRFEVEGLDKLWALRSQLEFPLAHVRGVRKDAEPARGWWHGLRLAGTDIPHVLTAGTFYTHEGVIFYDVHDPDRTIVFELDHEHYRRLVVEVENPAATIARVNSALAQRRRGTG